MQFVMIFSEKSRHTTWSVAQANWTVYDLYPALTHWTVSCHLPRWRDKPPGFGWCNAYTYLSICITFFGQAWKV